MQWSLASKDNKIKVQEWERPPLPWWSLHENAQMNQEPISRCSQASKDEKRNLEPRMRVLHENGEETKKEWRPVNLISLELLKYMTEDHFLNFIKQR